MFDSLVLPCPLWVCDLHMSVMRVGAARRLMFARFPVGWSLHVLWVYSIGWGIVLLPPCFLFLVLLAGNMVLP